MLENTSSGMPRIALKEIDTGTLSGEPWRGASPLSGSDIHLWRGDLRRLAENAGPLRRSLSASERERCRRLRATRDRWRWALGRGALRHVLARYLGSAPESLLFGTGEAGKPCLANHSRLQFNVSHSGELIVIAVTSGVPVGVDVERLRPISHMEGIARRWYSAADYGAIRRASSPQRKARLFFEVWTREEARGKATGDGLSSLMAGAGRPHPSIGSAWPVEAAPGVVGAVALCRGSGPEQDRVDPVEQVYEMGSNRMHSR
jgi:4'-phosphopantetheinyl transferase